MPLYELIYMMNHKLPLKLTAQIIKEKANIIFDNSGVLRRLENMGTMPLAYPMFRHQKKFFKARYILFLFDGSPQLRNQLEDAISKDSEIMRWVFYKQKNKFRDTYDEMYYHEGVEFGKTIEAREALLVKTQQEILNVMSSTKVPDYTEEEIIHKLDTDPEFFGQQMRSELEGLEEEGEQLEEEQAIQEEQPQTKNMFKETFKRDK